MSGVELIAKERERQITKEGFDAAHDDLHSDGELALAAVCYASPDPIFTRTDYVNRVSYGDPWPWDDGFDKRHDTKSALLLPDPRERSDGRRLDLLVKAGALIAAEIDRLLRVGVAS
jgi:hypothetical protein